MKQSKLVVACIALVSLAYGTACHAADLTIRVVDTQTKQLIPARVELTDMAGNSFVASDALGLHMDCIMAPMPSWLQQPLNKSIFNPYTETEQFYSTGISRVYGLDAGTYTVRTFRGPEYRVEEQSVQLSAEDSKDILVTMDRWYNAASKGWFGADDHLHLSRVDSEQESRIGIWMSAEGLDVANLLQMGTLTQFAAAPQYKFGEAGAQESADVLILAGQEHPRTHHFGHAITLGAEQAIDDRTTYTLYTPTLSAAKQLGGISGFAHWGIGPARQGLALTATTGNVEFLEVLQFEFPFYDVWYQLLNLGLPIAATAGTDFPCLTALPGRERFYTQVEGELNRNAYVEAIRAGKTFVTNGAMISLQVNGQDIGSRLLMESAGTVNIEAEVIFNAHQDDITALELIHNGVVLPTTETRKESTIHISTQVYVDRPSWFAARASGTKLGETAPNYVALPPWLQDSLDKWIGGGGGPEVREFFKKRTTRASSAHTSPIYIDFLNTTNRATKQADASSWLAQLDKLETLIKNEAFDEILVWNWIPYSDGVSREHLERNAPALLQAIRDARATLVLIDPPS